MRFFITVRLPWETVRTCCMPSCPVHDMCHFYVIYYCTYVNERNGDSDED